DGRPPALFDRLNEAIAEDLRFDRETGRRQTRVQRLDARDFHRGPAAGPTEVVDQRAAEIENDRLNPQCCFLRAIARKRTRLIGIVTSSARLNAGLRSTSCLNARAAMRSACPTGGRHRGALPSP